MQRALHPALCSALDWVGIAVVGTVLAMLVIFGGNIWLNSQAAGVTSGYRFLTQAAWFDLIENLIPNDAGDSYGRVIMAGLLKTSLLSICGLVLATVSGLVMRLVSMTPSPAGRMIALLYLEPFRILPKILVPLVPCVVAVRGLPPVREAI